MPDRSEKKYEQLLREAGCSEKVLVHCRAVRDVALEYAQRNPLVMLDQVREGAMLHDIGRGASHTILHAQRGADLLRAQGMDLQLMNVRYSGYLPVTACHGRQKRRSLPMPTTLLKGEKE
jgi:putative nucleotidyltransferase with HDIG domain